MLDLKVVDGARKLRTTRLNWLGIFHWLFLKMKDCLNRPTLCNKTLKPRS